MLFWLIRIVEFNDVLHVLEKNMFYIKLILSAVMPANDNFPLKKTNSLISAQSHMEENISQATVSVHWEITWTLQQT